MPIQSMSYSYNKLNSTDTSGEMQSGEVIYRNVKVSEDSGKGYSQYYFKLPSEYPSYSYVYNGNTVPLRPYHNLVKSGY